MCHWPLSARCDSQSAHADETNHSFGHQIPQTFQNIKKSASSSSLYRGSNRAFQNKTGHLKLKYFVWSLLYRTSCWTKHAVRSLVLLKAQNNLLLHWSKISKANNRQKRTVGYIQMYMTSLATPFAVYFFHRRNVKSLTAVFVYW